MLNYDIMPFGALPSQRQINHFKKYSKKAFFHFGINTFSNHEWGDGTIDAYVFNPSEADVRQWIRIIKAAGFTLAILTVKHHDGFCLWPSKYTDYTVQNSPYKNGNGDILQEFVDACREYGVAVGIYISPWDRNSKYWGSDEYSTYFNYQLTELMTQYGRIDEVWWDGAGSEETDYNWGLWAYTVRNYQPEAVIFGSLGAYEYVECRWIGNETGITDDPHYPTITPDAVKFQDVDILNSGVFGGERFIVGEVDTSIRPGWFYHSEQDTLVKSADDIIDLWFNSIGNGAFMLLNFPPDRRGIVHETDAKNSIEANRIITRALSVNYAVDAKVYVDSIRSGYCGDNVINEVYYKVYCASEDNRNPVVTLELPCKRTFDTVMLGEYIELGIRVRGFKVEVWCDSEWKCVADKKSIGFKKFVYIGKTITDKVRITFYDCPASPVIREIGLYAFSANGYRGVMTEKNSVGKSVDIAKNPSAKITYEQDGVLVQFGGIFPFNTIRFCGEGIDSYEILIFDGVSFQPAFSKNNPSKEETVVFPETIKNSYQFKLKTGVLSDESINIRVYEI